MGPVERTNDPHSKGTTMTKHEPSKTPRSKRFEKDLVPVNDGDRCHNCTELCSDVQVYCDGKYFCSDACADQHIEWNGNRDGAPIR
jgi:hypothetical protein